MFHGAIVVLLAALSVWDYPARWRQHEYLRAQFVEAVREGDTATMTEVCRKGIQLLPDLCTMEIQLVVFFRIPVVERNAVWISIITEHGKHAPRLFL